MFVFLWLTLINASNLELVYDASCLVCNLSFKATLFCSYSAGDMDVSADKAPEQRLLLESKRYANINILKCDHCTKEMANTYM